MQNRTPTEELVILLDRLQSRFIYLSDKGVKQNAMELVRNGADATSKSTKAWPTDTLLHFLVLHNAGGVNEPEIAELLERPENLVNIQNGSGRSPLQSLMDQFVNGDMNVEDFKRTAMQLARKKGADLTVKSDTEGNTLLHCLITSNKEGKNDKEIAELLNMNPGLARIRNKNKLPPCQLSSKNNIKNSATLDLLNLSLPSEELIALLDQLEKDEGASLAKVKQRAMELVRNGADASSRAIEKLGQTLLHFLVLNNADGVNDKEIEELLELQKDKRLANVKSGHGSTPFQALIDAFRFDKCTFNDFKRTAMPLARKGADLTVKSYSKGNTLLHYLVDNNKRGINNEKEMVELLKMNHNIALINNEKGKIPYNLNNSLVFMKDQATIDQFKIAMSRKERFFKPPENSQASAEHERDQAHGRIKGIRHAENKDQLILLLKNYIARIEDHEKPDKKGIDFGWNLIILQEKQATNREANYNLARDLVDVLEKDEHVDIQQLFSEKNITKMRSKYITAGFWGDKIHSSELNGIISDAREMTKKEDKSLKNK